MSIVDMKLSDEEKKDMHKPSVLEDGPEYPFGLHLHLNPDVVRKLAISEPPDVGSEMVILAKVKVDNVGLEHGRDDMKKMNIGLQITD